MKRIIFLTKFLCFLSVGFLFSCNKPLFQSKDECLSYIKSEHRGTGSCPGMSNQPDDYKWLRWSSGNEGEMLNGKVTVKIINYSDDEVDYRIDYNYNISDKWTGFGEIRYSVSHTYEVSRLWHIRKGKKNRPVIEFVSGRVHEHRDEAGPYSYIDTTYDE